MRTAKEMLLNNVTEYPLEKLSDQLINEIAEVMKEYAEQFIDEFEKRVKPTYDINYEGQTFLFTNAEDISEDLKEKLL